MPQKNKTSKSAAASKPNAAPPTGSSQKGFPSPAHPNPIEESLELWSRFARETGDTVTEYPSAIRR